MNLNRITNEGILEVVVTGVIALALVFILINILFL
jgi:hypothetical protein